MGLNAGHADCTDTIILMHDGKAALNLQIGRIIDEYGALLDPLFPEFRPSFGTRKMTIEFVRIDTVHSGWTKLYVATIRLPNGQTVRREIEDHGVAVCVLPYDPARRMAILVRQFRAPVFYAAKELETLEAIAGIVESSDPKDCARGEAREEAGLNLGTLEHVVTGWTMPGVSTERMHLYLAVYRQGDQVDAGGRADEHETITVAEMPLGELAAMADSGRLTDMKTLVLVQTLRLRRPDLFAR
jgi:nudix-type nucleoside diphosphatase (YffH/AdpP family)